uniref:Uncharacterized protein n=1 Tax=Arundo donax TaxID=35708 RepID=A0A0A9FJU6_ARUDO
MSADVRSLTRGSGICESHVSAT